MIIFYLIEAILAILFLLTAIAFLKAKDLFVMNHIVAIFAFYILPIIFLFIGIEKFSITSFAKILVIIPLNMIAVNSICFFVSKHAIANRTMPDADFKNDLDVK